MVSDSKIHSEGTSVSGGEKIGLIEYQPVSSGYIENRRLRKSARVFHLWALGVGVVISGNFFGWNFGLAAGGFGGLLVATVIITVMYTCLCFSMAEMASALPHTDGMGLRGGYVTGLAENREYILTPAVIVVAIGSCLGAIFGTPDSLAPVGWLAAYVGFSTVNTSVPTIDKR